MFKVIVQFRKTTKTETVLMKESFIIEIQNFSLDSVLTNKMLYNSLCICIIYKYNSNEIPKWYVYFGYVSQIQINQK